MDIIVITPNVGAMLSNDIELMLDGIEVATDVARIAVLRDQLEGDFLAAAADEHRNVWLLHAFGLIDGPAHLVVLALEGCLFLRPHGEDDLYGFAQVAQAFGGIGVVVAVGAILVLVPARADAKVESSVAHYIDGTGHFRQQSRVTIAVAGDHLADADTFGIACQGGGGGPGLKSQFLRGLWDSVKVVN